MADTVTVAERKGLAGFFANTRTFLEEVRTEFRKITWPDRQQLRQATVAIIIFVLLIGLVIYVMDLILQGVLVRLIPSLFGAG